MSYPENTAIGDRYQDSQGHTFIVAQLDDDGYPHLLDDDEILENPEGFEWTLMVWEAIDDHRDPLRAIESNPEMTRLITERLARERTIAEITLSVPSDRQRDLYNTVAAIRHYSGKLIDAQAKVDKISADRGHEIRRLVDIVGTQDKAAKLLGTNQSTISRAMRNRDNA